MKFLGRQAGAAAHRLAAALRRVHVVDRRHRSSAAGALARSRARHAERQRLAHAQRRQQRWMAHKRGHRRRARRHCAEHAAKVDGMRCQPEHNVQLPVLEAYLLRVDHDPICALEMALTGQYPIELLAEATPTSAAGKAMIAHNVGRTPLCILHQICWGVVRAVVVLPTLSLLEQYAVTHRSKLWGRVVARCYALDDGLPPKALRNLDLLGTGRGVGKSSRQTHRPHQHGRCGCRLDLQRGAGRTGADLEVYTDLVQLNRTGTFGNAIFCTLRIDTRGTFFAVVSVL